jgi:TPP-dependent pyruvate/acetoin dehydrogenase alpha subunit
MEGVRVDGPTPSRCATPTPAAARARAGEGPQFIEAVTFRAPTRHRRRSGRYMDPAQLRAARERSASAASRASAAPGVLDERAIGQIRGEAMAEMQTRSRRRILPEPDPRKIFDTTYALPPRALRRDRDSTLET